MPRDLVRIPPLRSSFLSFEKDVETIVKKLFIENRPYSDELKRLLCISAKDALEGDYKADIDKISVADLMDKYILIRPKYFQEEFDEEQSVILISFDNFVPNANNHKFRDCIIRFDILCNVRNWDLGNYRLRPLKIAGYIDGILNESRLSGIGTLNFAGCQMGNYGENLSGYTLMYYAIHGSDDEIPKQEVI